MQSGGAPRVSGAARQVNLTGITIRDLSRLLSGASAGLGRGGGRIFVPPDADDDDEDEEEDDAMEADEADYYGSFRRTEWFPKVTEPQQAGLDLLNSGDFGRVSSKLRSRRKDLSLAKLVLNRAARPLPASSKEDFSNVRRLPSL